MAGIPTRERSSLYTSPAEPKMPNLDLLQPGGLPAKSLRLSEATPPVNVKKDPRPRRGRSNQAMNLGTLPKTLQMLDSDW